MNDFEWIEETPADMYEVGEELCFYSTTWAHVTGNFIRQITDKITIKVTEVRWGPDDWIGQEMEFNKEDITNPIDVSSLFSDFKESIEKFTFTMDTWYEYNSSEEVIERDECEPHNPSVINYIKRWWYRVNRRLLRDVLLYNIHRSKWGKNSPLETIL